jgi:multidrug efflux pump subunit AcrA (membrane-fusion protein)
MENITYEKVLELFAATDAKIAKAGEQYAQNDVRHQARMAEYEAQRVKASALHEARMTELEAQLAKSRTELEVQLAKSKTELEAQLAKTDAQLAKTDAQLDKTGKYIKELAKEVGNITDALGRFAEAQVRPKILELFKEKGIELEETYPRVVVKKDGQFVLEIDLVLVNTIYAVIVEVKNTLRQRDIDEHLDRLEKLQTLPSKMLKGTSMFGAVAGMIVADEVENYAIKKGLYVIKTKGDNVEISNKPTFKGKQWAYLA